MIRTSCPTIIVDNDRICLEALRSMSGDIGLDVIGVFQSSETFIRSLEVLRPDLVVIKECMPGMFGSTCASHVKRFLPGTKILLITSSKDPYLLYKVWKCDIDGLMEKNTQHELALAVKCVLAGSRYMDPKCKAHIDRRRREYGQVVPHMFEILALMARGMTNHQIANELNKSYHTITTYVHRMTKHLGASNKTELISLAISKGWIRLEYFQSRNFDMQLNQSNGNALL